MPWLTDYIWDADKTVYINNFLKKVRKKTLSAGVAAGETVLLEGSPIDSFQSGGLRDALPLLRVGQLASLAAQGKRNGISTRISSVI